jgi:hypothetical protein
LYGGACVLLEKWLITKFALLPQAVWSRITREAAWCYKRGVPVCTGLGSLPSQALWDELRLEVNRARRRIRNAEARIVKAQAKDKHRSYMQRYAAAKRRRSK